jgi:hypothetical protein
LAVFEVHRKICVFQQMKKVKAIQGISEIRVLILTSESTRQFMKLFSITFCKIRKNTHRRVYTLMVKLFQILNQFVLLFS